MIEGDSIESIPVGLKTRFSKTVSESDVYLFAGITGDFDRIHIDEEFAKTTTVGARIAPGVLILGLMATASTLALQSFRRVIVSLGYDRVRFVKPVFLGDTVEVSYEVIAVDEERERMTANVEAKNQRGETVAVATHILKLMP
jgi:acyl dehydratase